MLPINTSRTWQLTLLHYYYISQCYLASFVCVSMVLYTCRLLQEQILQILELVSYVVSLWFLDQVLFAVRLLFKVRYVIEGFAVGKLSLALIRVQWYILTLFTCNLVILSVWLEGLCAYTVRREQLHVIERWQRVKPHLECLKLLA